MTLLKLKQAKIANDILKKKMGEMFVNDDKSIEETLDFWKKNTDEPPESWGDYVPKTVAPKPERKKIINGNDIIPEPQPKKPT
jgi:hypothetical protein